VAARLSDNPKGDPTYEDKLRLLPRVERERLLGGNWNIRPAAGLYFRRHMFDVLERRPYDDQVLRRIRAWDKAATEPSTNNPDPDWTVGVLLAELRSGGWVIEHVERLRGAPAKVEAAIRGTAQSDGIATEVVCWQDPGQAGVVDIDRMRHVLQGFQFSAIRASKDKITYAGVWQSQAEGRRISIVRGPWLESVLSTLESFPDGKHDDDVDAISLAFQAIFGSATIDTLLSAYDVAL
jgi:predicted phage terminase large subunit-like protein